MHTNIIQTICFVQSWVGPFLMSAVMANCIRRSNSINNYGTKLTYRESVVYPSFMAGKYRIEKSIG